MRIVEKEAAYLYLHPLYLPFSTFFLKLDQDFPKEIERNLFLHGRQKLRRILYQRRYYSQNFHYNKNLRPYCLVLVLLKLEVSAGGRKAEGGKGREERRYVLE